jgi:hypothetical protein
MLMRKPDNPSAGASKRLQDAAAAEVSASAWDAVVWVSSSSGVLYGNGIQLS